MLSFAAIVPHPPLLIPPLMKQDGAKKLKGTFKAFEVLEKELYLANPHILIVLTAHAPSFSDVFTVNLNARATTNYTLLGDIATKETCPLDITFAARINDRARAEGFSIHSVTEHTIDHSVGIPRAFLLPHLSDTRVVPVGMCNADAKTHYEFGYVLKHLIMESDMSVAIIASADLSHALTTESPAGFHKDGALFDQKIQQALTTGAASQLLTLEESTVVNAATCGYKPIITLMGALQRVHHTFKLLSYEAPYGVGYLTGHFAL